MSLQSGVLLGARRPRWRTVPPRVSSAGLEAVELAKSAGLILDPWEQDALVDGLGERADGKWAAFEVGLIVPRQNGKGSILEARELAGLYLFGEGLILHSAHEFKTASEAFRRIWSLIQNTPDLERRVQRVQTAHGQEGIELRGGQRLRFVARTSGSGRGFSGDTVILDETFHLPASAMEALVPTMAARPNAQLWYTSSAPLPGEDSAVLRQLCKRGRKGAPGLAFMEFCADDSAWDDLDDPEAWASANPALGIRINEEFILREREALGDDGFARERLGLWKDDDERLRVFTVDEWDACRDPASSITGPVCLAFDVTPDRAWSTIVACGARADGLPHVEVVAHAGGTGWVVDHLVQLVAAQKPAMVICDPAGPAGGLVPDLAGKVEVELIGTRDATQACGLIFDTVTDGARLRHLGQPELATAVDVADRRPVGDAWLWSRKNSAGVISPLVAATLALWAHKQIPEPAPPKVRVVNLGAALAKNVR